MSQIIKGYKVVLPDGKAKHGKMIYEVGETYQHKGHVELCASGFHFCLDVANCFSYYSFDSNNRIFEVEASGDVKHGEDKSACETLKVVREISWSEMLELANQGENNTGLKNTGYMNTGDRNTGNWNTGNMNTGYRNTGDRNTGNMNTGNRNTGYMNTGDRNTGDRNTGDRNTGDRNTGNMNTGYMNTGYMNTGNWNTGNWNTGNMNTGNWNTGNMNTGYMNTGDRNTGLFCTEEAPFPIFDMPSNWTEQDFKTSRAYWLMANNVDTKQWVPVYAMTDEEKKAFPSYKTAEGYLKDIPFKEAFTNAWHNWDAKNREAFTSLPNFNADKFFQITGVNL